MISETLLRVRYSETDQMGVVYYANYFVWMEVGRTDLIRKCGITYKEIEEKGYILPVVYVSARFLGSAYYDDEVVVRSGLLNTTRTKITIGYEILRETGKGKELICVGVSELVFVNKVTRRIARIPEFFANSVKIEETEEYRKFVELVKRSLKTTS